MSANNIISLPVYFPAGITIKPKDTFHRLKIDLKSSKTEIPKDALAKAAWIAMMHGSGYAELIWTVNNVEPDFIVSLFINNPTHHPITLSGPAEQDGHLLITFVLLYDLPELPKKPGAKKITV